MPQANDFEKGGDIVELEITAKEGLIRIHAGIINRANSKVSHDGDHVQGYPIFRFSQLIVTQIIGVPKGIRTISASLVIPIEFVVISKRKTA